MSMQNKLIMDTKDVDFELMNRTISSFAKTFSDNYCASFQEDSCSLEISESMITITVHRKLENIPLKSYEEAKQFYEEEGYTCTK